METTATLAPTMTFHASSPFVRLEDVRTQSTPSPASEDPVTYSHCQSSPPPIEVKSVPAKKRKSWGQELPEPKTALPPRKRAKTDDEKEQRRIERIKRNRAAAHNSRERKRQEAENLAVLLAHANAELAAYRKLHGPLPPDYPLAEVRLVKEEDGSPAVSVGTPAPSLVESHGSQADAASPGSPAHDLFQHPSPTIVKHESSEPAFSILPPPFEELDGKSTVLSPMGQTRDSAEILCDLQCRPSSKSHSSTSPSSHWLAIITHIMTTMQIQLCYRSIMTALWTEWPLQMRAMMRRLQMSSFHSTNSSTPKVDMRSKRRRLAQLTAATGLCFLQRHRSALDERQKMKEPRVRDAQPDPTQTALTEKDMSATDSAYDSDEERHDGAGVGRTGLA